MFLKSTILLAASTLILGSAALVSAGDAPKAAAPKVACCASAEECRKACEAGKLCCGTTLEECRKACAEKGCAPAGSCCPAPAAKK